VGGRIFPVILAGGASTRLWPASGREKPKWDLRLFGSADSTGKANNLLESAWERAQAVAAPADCYVVTGVAQARLVQASLPELPRENLLVEPEPRDTAGAVAFAAGAIMKKIRQSGAGAAGQPAVMLVLPGDHVIRPISRFITCAFTGAQAAAELGTLVTFGVVPRSPSTALGYIHRGPEAVLKQPLADGPQLYRVLQFREKPDKAVAAQYVSGGEYYWNSGIFMWTLEVLVREMERQLPEHAAMARALSEAEAFGGVVQQHYPGLKKTSIDFGIMEHAQAVTMVAADFLWDDIGSWSAVAGHLDRRMDNVLGPDTNLITVDAKGNFVFAPGKRVALIGVEGLAVFESENEILVCRLERDQDVRKASEEASKKPANGKG